MPKANELALFANIASTDQLMVVRSPSSDPLAGLVNASTFTANMALSNSVPANSSANGVAGTIRYDSSYLYICTTTNTWKRVAISTW